MDRSADIGELAGALAKARASFRSIGKDKTAKIASSKGAFSYSYADLATVVDATTDALAANGIAVMQPASLDSGQVVVTTLLAHSSGQWISERMAWPVVSSDNRSIGSGITYARRHSLLAMVGAAASDEDDDAEEARGGDRPMDSHEPARQHDTRPDPALIAALEQSIAIAKEQGFEAVQALAARLNAEAPARGPERERLQDLYLAARREAAKVRFTGPSAAEPTSPSSPSEESASSTGKRRTRSSSKTTSNGEYELGQAGAVARVGEPDPA